MASILTDMAPSTNPVPPPRRESRRFAIPTPADLRHPRQGGSSTAQVAQADPASPPGAEAHSDPGGETRPSSDQPPQAQAAAPRPTELQPSMTPDRPTPPEPTVPPGDRAVRPEHPGPPTPATLPRPTPEPIPPTGPTSRRIFPNPATLMASGRGGRKVRTGGLRGRRLPKVEETSAGGVVLDLTRRPPSVALIARHDRRSRLLWSLPKGHVEPGETAEEAALREVLEETGLVGRIVAPLGVIDFWFVVEDRRIHKTVHHFVIEAIGGELSDEDLEVEAVEWIPFDQVVRKLAYGDERRLVEKAAQIVPGLR